MYDHGTKVDYLSNKCNGSLINPKTTGIPLIRIVILFNNFKIFICSMEYNINPLDDSYGYVVVSSNNEKLTSCVIATT